MGNSHVVVTDTSLEGDGTSLSPLAVSQATLDLISTTAAAAAAAALTEAELAFGHSSETFQYSNVAMPDAEIVRYVGDNTGANIVSGFVAAKAAGVPIYLYNASGYNLTIVHEAGPTATNRVRCANATDLVIRPDGGAIMMKVSYPGGNRWIVLGVNA